MFLKRLLKKRGITKVCWDCYPLVRVTFSKMFWVMKPLMLVNSNRVFNEYSEPKGHFVYPLFNYGNKIISNLTYLWI